MGQLERLKLDGKVQENIQSSSPSSSSKGKVCKHCGKFVPVIQVWGRTIQPICNCESERWERERKQIIDYEKKRRIEKLFDNSKLGKRFMNCKFRNWEHRSELENVFNAAVSFAKNIDKHRQKGTSIIFFGPPGTGKSHLAAAIVHDVVDKGIPAVFQNVPSLLLRIRATYNGGKEKESQLLHALTDAELLVLDDLGAEKYTEWTESILYTIINERYDRLKPTVFTTNCGLEKLEEQIGWRTMDRLNEICEFKEVVAESYRKIIARRRKKNRSEKIDTQASKKILP